MGNRKTNRRQGGQAAPLAAMTGLAALGVELALLLTFRILRRDGNAVWLTAAILLLPFAAGTVWYRGWRRHGGLKNYSSFKLFLAGAAALAASGPLMAICSAGGVLAALPAFLLGACTGGFWEAIQQIFRSFGEFVHIFPQEKGKMVLWLVLWGLVLASGFALSLVCAAPAWALWTALLLGPGACGLLAEVVLARRCCLSDQRGLEMERERILKEI